MNAQVSQRLASNDSLGDIFYFLYKKYQSPREDLPKIREQLHQKQSLCRSQKNLFPPREYFFLSGIVALSDILKNVCNHFIKPHLYQILPKEL